ncbi:MAG: hypothetical protein KBD63_07625, partial [Bacteriovoracaceae bacterium]|nr:hypothetical protein [Bacteriovoracaceae bacterium]
MNSYTFNSFTPLKGSKLILIKLTAEHIIPLSQALLDVDGFFANHRGLKDEKSIQENLAQILELNQKKERLTLVAQLKSDKS